MKYLKSFFVGTMLIFSSAVFTGCGDYVGKEKTHPLFVKAGASRAAGNYKESAQFYEDFLYVCPKSPLAHLELASVYGDNLDEPFRAMYHYEKYLELHPNSPDAMDVKKFSDACRKRIFEKLSADYVSTETAKAQEETARYKKKMEEYVEYSRKLRAQNEQMKEMIRSGRFTREVSVRPLRTNEVKPADNDPVASGTVTVRTAQPNPKPQVQPRQNPAAAVQGERTYTVSAGDTIGKISRKMYGSARHWPKIRDANPGKVGKNGQIRIGVTLKIPALGGSR
ncbi:MAG: LysM peptidoglycan-binding domain-containing protein [Lentisphaeria bacterium]|nr:LysM peptidoglycan-binding domain-containing protein [Lentisphaeria bacterium]